MLHQTIFNTSEVCHSSGVRHAVMSPGSRNAPLTISFARNEKIKKWIIPDERSAGFVALGIAQKLRQPVVLCCTSGTALLNYAPAIAEAFYRELPLVVLSADRPPELIDQRDGQTIRQFEALRNHVKASKQLPIVESQAEALLYTQKLLDGMEESLHPPLGPVHINIPFKEPFYPSEGQNLSFQSFPLRQESEEDTAHPDLNSQVNDLTGKKVLFLIGQQPRNSRLEKELSKISVSVPVIAPSLSNLNIDGVQHPDLFLKDQRDLKPEVLITSGLSVLSKKLKLFIREHKPEQHYHFDPSGVDVDTYGTSPQIIKSDLTEFLESFKPEITNLSFVEKWKQYSIAASEAIEHLIPELEFSETSAFHSVLKSLPKNIDLHLSNSMPVRFADVFGHSGRNIEAWCNRGTSGIDGCTSTAIGTSMVSDNLNILLTGDLSFFYDRNAFFNNYKQSNLRLVVFNNMGGGIFRLIDGPAKLPELEEYFETRHERTAEYICLENEIDYSQAQSLEEIESCFESFYEKSENPKLLEIFTNPETNEQVFKKLKSYIHEHINF